MVKTNHKTIVVPTLTDAHSPLGALQTRLRELEARRSELESDLVRIRRGKPPKSIADTHAAERSARSAALVGDVIHDAGSYRVRNPAPISFDAEAEALREELADVEGAISILKAELPAADNAAQDAVCSTIEGDFKALLRQLAVSVARTAALHARFKAVTTDLNHWDIKWTSRLPNPASIASAFGDGRDTNNKADAFLRDVVAAGVIGIHEVEEARNG